MQSSPHTEPPQTTSAQDGGGTISRRTLAKGAAWAAPTVLLAAPAPAAAASIRDVIVRAEPCDKDSLFVNRIPFSVTTVYGATVPAGTRFEVNYAGGSRAPSWDGRLAENSNVTWTPGNNSSINGGRWGTIVFILRTPMPANTTWNLNIHMDIGASVTDQRTSLKMTTSLPNQNKNTANDLAYHEMYRGGCGT